MKLTQTQVCYIIIDSCWNMLHERISAIYCVRISYNV